MARQANLWRRLGQGLLFTGVISAMIVGWFWYRSSMPQLPKAAPIPHTDVNPLGANFFLDREVERWKQEKTLEMASAAGIGWIKQQFSWEEIEPHGKGEFDWAKYDRIVDLAERYGMQIIARLDRPPDWTREDNQFKTRPPDNVEDYGDFVYEFVNRFRGRVRYVQIWNEPNLTAEWGFQRVDAVAYTRMLEVAYRRAKEADPNIFVLSAPLAITLEDASMRGNHNDLVFLEQMYQAGAGNHFDILSANAFGLDRPPEDPPDPSVLNFRRVELQREIMERYGDVHKPVWINEYGWNAPPESFPEEILTWERVTEEEQAAHTVRGIIWAREHWPWLGVVNIWYFRQVGDVASDRPAYYFALVDPEFNPRPVYEAVRETAQGMDVATPGLHQETSPAISARRWQMVLDTEASAGAALIPGEVGGELFFAFAGNGAALVTLPGQESARLWIEVDGKPPAGMPMDESGRAYVDLPSATSELQAVVPLVDGLGEGVHHLMLSPDNPSSATVDAFLVTREVAPAPFYVLWGGCAVLALAGLVLWRHGARY
jgi:hypothetical protein